MRIDVYHHQSPSDELKQAISMLANFERNIMSALDDLKQRVEANTQVSESAIVLLQGLKAKLDDAISSGDPAQVQLLADQLGTETQRLADAITANTPADPTNGNNTGNTTTDGNLGTGNNSTTGGLTS